MEAQHDTKARLLFKMAHGDVKENSRINTSPDLFCVGLKTM